MGPEFLFSLLFTVVVRALDGITSRAWEVRRRPSGKILSLRRGAALPEPQLCAGFLSFLLFLAFFHGHHPRAPLVAFHIGPFILEVIPRARHGFFWPGGLGCLRLSDARPPPFLR